MGVGFVQGGDSPLKPKCGEVEFDVFWADFRTKKGAQKRYSRFFCAPKIFQVLFWQGYGGGEVRSG